MEPVTFKKAICVQFNLSEANYESFVLSRTLFNRVRLIRPIVGFVFPNFLFNEKRLVEKVAGAENLREIQEEVDFYQHKYVVNSVIKDALRFRLSGMRIMSMAHKAFRASSDGR
jgi:hypothetical protein